LECWRVHRPRIAISRNNVTALTCTSGWHLQNTCPSHPITRSILELDIYLMRTHKRHQNEHLHRHHSKTTPNHPSADPSANPTAPPACAYSSALSTYPVHPLQALAHPSSQTSKDKAVAFLGTESKELAICQEVLILLMDHIMDCRRARRARDVCRLSRLVGPVG
jgi:hypothetical protein